MRWMPAGAIFKHELGGLLASWLVRLWFVATVVWTLLALAASWGSLQTAPMLQAMLFPYLVFPWFLVVMVLGISPVTGSRLDWLSDGILSRPITRWEYLFASWAARVIAVLAVYLAVIVPVTLLAVFAKRNVAEDQVTGYGLLATLTAVSLIQIFQVTLGFLVGTLLRRPMLAAVVLVFTWLPVNLVLSTFSLEQFSPWTMYQAVPSLLRTPWSVAKADEAPAQAKDDAQALAAQAELFARLLSGQAPTPAQPQRGGFLQPREFSNLSLMKILAGYGLPSLAALALSLLVFNRRDL
jgi:ABC-type transport system involved in multi-copper enzyme maturation permease subunit